VRRPSRRRRGRSGGSGNARRAGDGLPRTAGHYGGAWTGLSAWRTSGSHFSSCRRKTRPSVSGPVSRHQRHDPQHLAPASAPLRRGTVARLFIATPPSVERVAARPGRYAQPERSAFCDPDGSAAGRNRRGSNQPQPAAGRRPRLAGSTRGSLRLLRCAVTGQVTGFLDEPKGQLQATAAGGLDGRVDERAGFRRCVGRRWVHSRVRARLPSPSTVVPALAETATARAAGATIRSVVGQRFRLARVPDRRSRSRASPASPGRSRWPAGAGTAGINGLGGAVISPSWAVARVWNRLSVRGTVWPRLIRRLLS
jgi:hypothetical protein